MVTRIRRYVETDTGHRVPNHKSKCRHMHGHRYRFEAEIEGDVVGNWCFRRRHVDGFFRC